jgi:hypothetical protein
VNLARTTHDYYDTGTIKFHKICHWPEMIQHFGATSNYNGETWETAHKWFVKRWRGKMPHENASSMGFLMKRNLEYEYHGGSSILKQPERQTRANFDVMSKIAGTNCFNKIYFASVKAWVKLGVFVLYEGGTRGGNVGKLVKIERGAGVILVSIQECELSDSASILASHCQRWKKTTSSSKLTTVALSESNDWGIELYPMQPDFSCPSTHVYSCPSIYTR